MESLWRCTGSETAHRVARADGPMRCGGPEPGGQAWHPRLQHCLPGRFRELAEAPWQAVLQAWVPRLAPGLWAAATHGPIRTGHAVRSLAARTTPQRLHELAEGLGYWAARYQVLPGRPAGRRTG